MWNVRRRLYKSGALNTVAREWGKYRLDFVENSKLYGTKKALKEQRNLLFSV